MAKKTDTKAKNPAAGTTKSQKKSAGTTFKIPQFLSELLAAKAPTGHEYEAQAVVDKFVAGTAHEYKKDVLGNRIATINPKAKVSVMFAGHLDELGLQISYIDEKGFLYFSCLGGHDLIIPSGRRIHILTKNGVVLGVTGKRAVHLLSPSERTKVPAVHEMWIDIGARSREDAEKRVEIGDVGVYDVGLEILNGSIAVARAFDDRAGCYIVMETLLRLAKEKIAVRVDSVATSQEEIGTRGAQTAAQGLNPTVGIAVDVTHSTDHPDADNRKFGRMTLSGGPAICRGPNITPKVFEKLVAAAKKANVPVQIEADPRPTGTDARVIQMANGGVATGLVSVPLRYMHTPGEVVDLAVVEQCVQLLVEFVKSLKADEDFTW